MDGLNSLYHKLSPGGFCIVDDYFAFPECRAAVTDFMKAKSLNITIERVDEECVFWQKPK